jgi:hypothetical protein
VGNSAFVCGLSVFGLPVLFRMASSGMLRLVAFVTLRASVASYS